MRSKLTVICMAASGETTEPIPGDYMTDSSSDPPQSPWATPSDHVPLVLTKLKVSLLSAEIVAFVRDEVVCREEDKRFIWAVHCQEGETMSRSVTECTFRRYQQFW